MASESIIAQFVDVDGKETGPQVYLPMETSTEQLNALINELLEKRDMSRDDDDDSYTPSGLLYRFRVEETDVKDELSSAIKDTMKEGVVKIIFLPQAPFIVRPVCRLSASLEGHGDAVLHVRFSPCGKHLCSASGDTTVRSWDLNTHTPLQTMKGHKNWVMVLEWAPDGKKIASGSLNGEIRVWSMDDSPSSTPSDASTVSDPSSNSSSSSGSAAPEASGSDAGRCMMNLPQAHSKYITAIAWEPYHRNPDCSRFVSSSKDGTSRVWDIRTGRMCLSLTGHSMSVTSVKWSGEGLIITASQDRTINVYDGDTGRLLRKLLGHGHWVNNLALNTDYALRSGPFDHNPPNWTTKEEGKQKALQRYLAVKGNRPERLISGSDDNTIIMWEPETAKTPLMRLTGHQQPINIVSYSPDGLFFASASFDKSLKIWDGITGKFIATFRSHVGAVYQICWSADSRIVVSGSKDSTIKVWEIASKKLLFDLPGHADEVYSVDWSPNASCVASGSKDRLVKIWRR